MKCVDNGVGEKRPSLRKENQHQFENWIQGMVTLLSNRAEVVMEAKTSLHKLDKLFPDESIQGSGTVVGKLREMNRVAEREVGMAKRREFPLFTLSVWEYDPDDGFEKRHTLQEKVQPCQVFAPEPNEVVELVSTLEGCVGDKCNKNWFGEEVDEELQRLFTVARKYSRSEQNEKITI